MPANPALIVLCTCPDLAVARRLARLAVAARHAACVNVIEGVSSVYAWQGEVCEDGEVLLVAKTTRAAYPALEAAWREAHPYELPEVVAVDVACGSEPYLAWVGDSVSA
ncbi:MAG: divalent-cation tolerance protein CutA [Gammaproteobacteria bacterium]|nr:divalent-cation tolerance protein CutA [Gammaproteobacteria bacterium]MCP5200579.1 divalent-cation tolerance protein CutA [Gammaproteobacteria bacterium]